MSETECRGSKQSPDSIPSSRRHTCHVCGQIVPVYMRRMDWSRPEHLYLGDHERVAETADPA